MKFFIYSRKSVYTGRGESTENQIEMCKKYIDNKFPQASEHEISIYEDEGFSAKDTKRPQFKLMISHIKANPPDFVICYRLDRISRSVSDFSSFIENLNSLGISFICIKEEFDTSKPMGKAMMYIASVFSQLERETIAERVRDNMLLLAKTGRWLGGTPPTGYTSEKICEIIMDGKTRTSYKLSELWEELEIVRLIFKIFLKTQKLTSVQEYLNENNILSKSKKQYSISSIKQILKNPVYCIADKDAFNYFTNQGCEVCFGREQCKNQFGIIAYNKRNYSKKGAPRNPMSKWIIAMGRHQGIIDGRKWSDVQRLLDKTGLSYTPYKKTNDYSVLSGRIICSKCQSPMISKLRNKKVQKDHIRRFDYICSSKLHRGREYCDCQNISGAAADKAVLMKIIEFTMENIPENIKNTHKDSDYIKNLPTETILELLSIEQQRDIVKNIAESIIWDGEKIKLLL